MKISARNQFKGRATVLHIGQVNADVSIDIGGGDRITALITSKSLEDLGIRDGVDAYALVKASSVMVMTADTPLRLSARNQLRGIVVKCQKGTVNSEVAIQLAGGETMTAIITNESMDALELSEGAEAIAVFKSTSVILGVTL
ncbi:MAG: TOBE domain-containing protein [Candidatus Competibacteraceae bacterium]|nr:TOBE domain-containing protein [Candidatus Competibacteraceae bacterium]HRY16387.1 TOBE domain-containing protein [Candidatus Competibacteraceae bacterium]